MGGLKIDYLSPTLYLTDILMFLVLFFWALTKRKKLLCSVFEFLHSSRFYLIILVIFGCLLFAVNFVNPFSHILKIVKIIELFFIGLYISKKVSIKQYSVLIIVLSVGVVFESTLAIVQLINKGSLEGILYLFGERAFNENTPGIAQAIINGKLLLRPYGTLPHPNVLAGYLLVCFFLISFNNKIKWFYYLTSILIFEVIFLSFSRSVWLTGSILFFIVGILNIKKLFSLIRNQKIIFVMFPLLFVVFIFLLNPIKDRFYSLKNTDMQTIEKRNNLSNLSVEMFKSSPLIGVGLNNFIPNIPLYAKDNAQIRWYQPVHNIYLLILSEAGVVGFVIFILFIYKTLKKNKNKPLVFYLALATILLVGLFDHYFITLQQTEILFAVVIGLFWTKIEKK